MEKLLRWAVFILLFFIPLFSPEWFPYLNLVYPILILSLFALLVLDRIFLAREARTFSKMLFPVLLLAFAFVCSAIFSREALFNIINIQIVYSVILFILSLSVFNSPADRKNAAFALLTGAVFAAIYSFYQKYTGLSDMAVYLEKHKEIVSNPVVYQEFLKNIGAGRVFSTFLNANVFAGYLAMVIPVALGCFLALYKDTRARIGIGLVILTLLASLLLTRSAGGMLSVLAAIFLFLLTVIKEKKKLLLWGGVLTAICIVSVVLLRPDIFDFSKADNSILNRLGYFGEALRIFIKNPVFGSGVNTYSALAADGIKYPHNWYLQVLSETGLAGFTALIFFIFMLGRESIRTLTKISGSEKYIYAGLLVGFIGFLFHNLLDIDSNLWQNSLIAFTLGGIISSGFKSNTKIKSVPAFASGVTGFVSRNYFFIITVVLMAASIMLSFSRFENEALLVFVSLTSLLFLLKTAGDSRFVRTKLDYFIIALLFISFISLIVSVNRFVSFQAVYLLLGCILLYYATVNSLNKVKDTAVFSFFTGLGCLLISLTGIFQNLWLKLDRVDAFFPNPNLLGGFLAAGIGFLLYNILREKGKIRVFYIVSTAFSLTCLIMTKSRGALLALGVIIIFFLFALTILKRKRAVKEPVRFWTTVSILLILGILITPLNPIVKRAIRDGVYDDAAYSRGKMAICSYKLFKDRPILGYGLKTYKDVAPKYRFPEGGTIGNYTRELHHAHNEYLQTMVELGTFGAVLILVFLFVLVRRFYSIIKNTKDEEKIFTAFAVFTALLGLLVQALVDFNFHCLPTLMLFVLLTGLLFSGYFTGKRSLVIEKPYYTKFRVYVTLVVALLLISAGMSYLSTYFYRAKALTVGDYEKNLKLSVFLNPLFAGGQADIGKLYRYTFIKTKDKKLFFEAEKYFKSAINKSSEDALYNKHLGLLYFYAGYPSLAVQEYMLAIKKSPYDVFLKAELAGICFFDGKYEYAEKYAREAVRLEPNFAGAHGMLSNIYLKMKNRKASEFEKDITIRIIEQYKDSAVIDYEKMLLSLGGKR